MEVRRVAALTLILLVCFFAGFVSPQPNQRSYAENSYSPKESRQGLSSDGKNETPGHPNETNNNPPKWYAAFKRPEWWLVFVAFLTFGFIGWQAWETRRSVEAANKNVEFFIAKERARLRVDIVSLDLSPENGAYGVNFKVSIFGSSPAFIVDTKCAAFIGPKEWMDDPETSDRAMHPFYSFPSVIPPGSGPIDAYAFIGLATDAGIALQIQAVKDRGLFVGIRGIIIYTDVFDRKRNTSFRYFCDYSDIPGLANGWTQCGEPKENEAT
jgi:hypothetical protein